MAPPRILQKILYIQAQLLKGIFRSSPPKVFLRKGVLKICSKFTGEHSCQSVISIKLLCWHIKFMENIKNDLAAIIKLMLQIDTFLFLLHKSFSL